MQQSPKTFGWKWPVFLIVITAELYYMFQYSANYGVLNLLALTLGSIILGVVLMRWEGAVCWNRILYMQQHNISTTDEMRDGVLILFAGILMIIPGIITDVLGLLLFLPPIRWVVRKLFLRNLYFEIPEKMDSQFRMYSFTMSNQSNDNQNNSYNNEDDSSEDYSESYQEQYNRNSDVQIIDVKATDPKDSSRVIESEEKEENKDNFENRNGSAQSD